MASGGKVYIADKETLDGIKNNVGNTADNGGGTGSGTIFAKLNAIIGSIAPFVTLWSQQRAERIDYIADKATRIDGVTNSIHEKVVNTANVADVARSNTEAEHTPLATGKLSQKLSYIIQQCANLGQKKLVSKQISFQVSATGTHTILEVTGGGQFEYAHTSLVYSTNVLVIECDGVAHRFSGKSGTCLIGRFLNYPTAGLSCVTSDAFNNISYLLHQPLYFKDRLRIYVEKSNPSDGSFHGLYSVYE